jgi:hypothetical protein
MAYGQSIRDLERIMAQVNTKLQRDLTLCRRVLRRFSQTEITEFLSVDEFGATGPKPRSAAELGAVRRPVLWLGVRLIPSRANIQNGNITLFFLSRRRGILVYRVLRAEFWHICRRGGFAYAFI